MNTLIQLLKHPPAPCIGAALLLAAPAQSQNLYVSQSIVVPNRIYTFTPGGTQSTFVSSGLLNPAALAFNSAGDLFEADRGTGNVYEFTPGGVRSTFASGLNQPEGLAFDSIGNLYVSQSGTGPLGTGGITKITPGGAQSIFASGITPGGPGLAFNSAGNLFAPVGGSTIQEFTPGGTASTFASGLFQPRGLAFDTSGDLFVTASTGTNGIIYKYTPGGVRSTFSSGTTESPLGLAFNSAGDLFVVDAGSGNIYEFAPNGTRTTFASGLPGAQDLVFSVPEPSISALLGMGFVVLLGTCARFKLKRVALALTQTRACAEVSSNPIPNE